MVELSSADMHQSNNMVQQVQQQQQLQQQPDTSAYSTTASLIYDLLVSIQNAQTKKEDRSKAQNRLKSLSQYVVQHARDVCEVAQAPSLLQTDQVKQHACIYLKGHVQRSIKAGCSSSELFEMADITIGLLVSTHVPQMRKVHIQDALQMILKEDGLADENNVRVTEDLFQDFLGNRLKIAQFGSLQSFNQVVQHMGGNDPCGVVRVLNAFLLGIKDRSQSLKLLHVCQPLLTLLMSNDFFNPLFQAIQALSSMPGQQNQEQRQQQISLCEQSLSLLTVWLQLHLSLLKHYNKGNSVDGLKYFASTHTFSLVLRSTLMLAANTREVQVASGSSGVRIQKMATQLVQHSESTTLMPLQGDTNKLRLAINQVAAKAMHFYKVIWQFLWIHKPEDLFNGENPFIVDAHYFFPQLVDTLTYLPHCNDLEAELENADVRKIIMKALEVISFLAKEHDFAEFYSAESFTLFMRIVLPFLKVTDGERETMETDPKEFCNLIDDVCGDQKSSTVKVKTSQMLIALCENVVGIYQQIMKFCMDSISRSFKNSSAGVNEGMADESNPEVTARLESELERMLAFNNLKFDNQEELIEVCLVSMTATWHLLQSNRDIHQEFDLFMLQNIDILLRDKTQDVLVRQRASLLCTFTLDLLYQTFESDSDRDNGLDVVLHALLEQIQDGKKNKVLSLQALETLQSSVGDDAFGQRIQMNFDVIIDRLASYITNLNLPDFFDFIVSFVQIYHGSFTENNLSNLMQVMVARIITEHELSQEASKPKKTLDLRQGKITTTKKKSSKNIEFRIAKCWSVIRYVAEHQHFVDRMVPVIEQCSIPLLRFMENPEQINFDDDLIFFISSLLRKSKSTNSVILQQAFQFLPKFVVKFNYIFGPLIECLSLYTMYSRVNDQNVDWIATSQENLQILFEMVKAAFFPPIPQSSPLEEDGPSYSIEGALVLQIVFQNLNGAPLLNYLIGPTVQLVFDKLSQGGNQVTQTLKRHLILTLLSCSLQNPNMTLEAIYAKGGPDQVTQFFKQLIEEKQNSVAQCSHKNLRSAYEIKVYSVALTNIVFQATTSAASNGEQQSANALIPRPTLLRQVVLALTKQQRNEQRQLRKAAEQAAASKRKQDKKKQGKSKKSTTHGDTGENRQKSTLIKMMVDNILREGEEVGLSSAEEDGDLSGDEIKTPIFVIKRGEEAATEESMNGKQQTRMDDGDEGIDSEGEAAEFFVQEEYDLANNFDQMMSRMDTFDEYKHLRDQATQCHQQNQQAFQALVNEGLTSGKQKEYLKVILQSQRVVLFESPNQGTANKEQNNGGAFYGEAAQKDTENVPRRIVRVKRGQNNNLNQ